MGAVLFHNPRCSKSRQAKALLEEKGVDFDDYLYLDEFPDEGYLKRLQRMLGIEDPRAMMRTKEAEYDKFGLAEKDGDDLLRAMAAHPKLIERPIFVFEGRAVIGRPPEAVLELL